MKQLLLPFFSLAVLLYAAPLAAQEGVTNALTPGKIRQFIERVTKKTQPGSSLEDHEVSEYLEAHLFDEGIYVSNIIYKMPEMPDQKQQALVDKRQYIENVLLGRTIIKEYESEVDVTDIKIMGNRKSATIETLTTESGLMPVDPEHKQYLPFEGKSTCQQQLKLLKGMITILSATCQTVTEIKRQ